MNASKKLAYATVIEPTLRGIENVLAAVNRTESVEKRARQGPAWCLF
jgi:hypothetical protein